MHYSKTSEKTGRTGPSRSSPQTPRRAREGKHLLPPRLPPGLQLAWAPALGSTQNPPEPAAWSWQAGGRGKGGSDLALSSGPPFPAPTAPGWCANGFPLPCEGHQAPQRQNFSSPRRDARCETQTRTSSRKQVAVGSHSKLVPGESRSPQSC